MKQFLPVLLLVALAACAPDSKSGSADSLADTTTASYTPEPPSGISFSGIYNGISELHPGLISVDSVGSYHILDITNQNYSRHLPSDFQYPAKSFVFAVARARPNEECMAIWYSVKSEDSDELVVVLYDKDSLARDYYVAAIGGEMYRTSKVGKNGRIYSALFEGNEKLVDVSTNYADIKGCKFELSDMDTRSYDNTDNGVADSKEYIKDYFDEAQ